MDAAPATPAAAPVTPPVDPAAVVADAAKGAPAAGADRVMEERLTKLANERDALRTEYDGKKDLISDGETKRKAAEKAKAGDYLGAMEILGFDPDDFYVKATDQINAREKAKKDPTKAAEEVIERHETKKQEEARLNAEKNWKSAAGAEIEKSFDSYPDVARAIASGKISYDDVMKVGYAEAANGRDSSAPVVLKLIQEKLKPAPAADPGKPAAAAAPASGKPPAASNSDVPVDKPVDEGDLSVEEAFERAKKKHLKR